MERHTSGVSFDIVLDKNVAKPEPKRMLLLKNRQNKKEPLTADEIEKKLKLAEERRQARIEARLKRMHEREESTRKLAASVDILLQQQSLRSGHVENADNVPVMSPREILKTGNNVVKMFRDMQQQLLNIDLTVDERKRQVWQVSQLPETKWQKALSNSRKTKSTQMSRTPKLSLIPVKKPESAISSEAKTERKHEGVAFEIPFDDLGGSKQCAKKPAIASLQKERSAAERRELIAKKLEEKQRKAEERRQKRLENKVRRTRESREALMELRTKVNIFKQHQAALKGEADPSAMLPTYEAARLAQDIADGFSSIHSRYQADLEKAEGFSMVYYKICQ